MPGARRITLIAAVAHGGVIGADGGIPWHLPADLAHFKNATLGHTVVMGRATFESIGRPLPGRTTVVLTRDPDWSAPGVRVAHDLAGALAGAAGEVWVAGGEAVYAAALPLADAQVISEVDLEVPGDTFHPAYPPDPAEGWHEVSRTPHDGFQVVRWERHPRRVRPAPDG